MSGERDSETPEVYGIMAEFDGPARLIEVTQSATIVAFD